ncbi:MAG: hypothetical protein VB071_06445 [Lawsonibacter sp.]|nr:hypothetical protein [Lawsonibacter sp.]
MEHNPDDLKMSFYTDKGVKIEIYDTYCKNFTEKDKEILDAKINEILYRAEMRRYMAKLHQESGTAT